MLTADGISLAVSGPELIATIVLFVLIYLVLIIAWARIVARFIKQGPVVDTAKASIDDSVTFMASDAVSLPSDQDSEQTTSSVQTKEGE